VSLLVVLWFVVECWGRARLKSCQVMVEVFVVNVIVVDVIVVV